MPISSIPRPILLASSPGWRSLRDSVRNGKRVHAYLFECGGFQAGSFFGRAFAALLNCPAADPPCLTCPTCERVLDGSFPGLSEVWPAGTAVTIGQTREIIRDSSTRFGSSLTRVVLVHGADHMREEAANALLKVLEEPASDMVLVLLAVQTEDVLGTIRSRCQTHRLSMRPGPELASALGSENSDALSNTRLTLEVSRESPSALEEAARIGPGSLLASARQVGEGDLAGFLAALLGVSVSAAGAEKRPARTAAGRGKGKSRASRGKDPAVADDTAGPAPAGAPGVSGAPAPARVLETLEGASYPLALLGALLALTGRIARERSLRAALQGSERLLLAHGLLVRAAAHEALVFQRDARERFGAGVSHPLLADDKKYAHLVGDTHVRLVLALLVRVLEMASRRVLDIPVPEAVALGRDDDLQALAALGTPRLYRVAQRLHEVTGLWALNTGVEAVLDEALLALTDPIELLPGVGTNRPVPGLARGVQG